MPSVFISYARKDGEAFATGLRERLEREEAEIDAWQDRAEMEGGRGWWKQITEALDKAQFLVLVMTPAAMESEMTRKEWRYAREKGVCVYPVKGVPDSKLDYQSIPQWMRKAHFFDLDKEWETFVNHLKSPCLETRVPFMAPDLTEGFVERPAEFDQLLQSLLAADGENPVAITTALEGAGGFGKTTLAIALCHHDDITTAYDDGILWVTLGESPDIPRELTKLYAALTGERPGFVDAEDAARELSEQLKDKNCLLVIDDVWNKAHLRPFLRGGRNCARLITTRRSAILEGGARINVDEMTQSESIEVLKGHLDIKPENLQSFIEIAKRLGEWPLMLELAAAVIRKRIAQGDTLENALDYIHRALEKRGVRAFDHRDAIERNQAIARTIEVSLEFLKEDERERYLELAVFPEDTDIPLTTLSALWDLDEFDTEELVSELHGFSLLKFDLQQGTIRLHDVLRAYLGELLSDPTTVHSRLLDGWGDFHHLPDGYAWRCIAYHLKKAGREDELRKLLLDFKWLQAKLEAVVVSGLISDYDFIQNDSSLRLMQGAIRLSAHVLSHDKSQLAGHLLGRLSSQDDSKIQRTLSQVLEWKAKPWLRPILPTLTPPGGFLLCTLTGHSGRVMSVATFEDGRRAISASIDNTLKVWDLEEGKEIRTLEGHSYGITAVAIFEDGRRAISASLDETLKVWDLEEGKVALTLKGHSHWITSAAIFDHGRRAISGSCDETLKVWDLEEGMLIRTLKGHSGRVYAVEIFEDGRRAISACKDETLKVWDLEEGKVICTLEGHSERVNAVAIFDHGRRAVSASEDNTLKVWDLEEGNEIHDLKGHLEEVNTVTVLNDGRHVASASRDHTLKVWDLEDGKLLRTITGHSHWLYVGAIFKEGQYAVNAPIDDIIRIWDLENGKVIRTLKGHSSLVNAVAIFDEGRRAISASLDDTLKVWDLKNEKEIHTLEGHSGTINAIAIFDDGRRAISASNDNTLRVWDLEEGNEIRTLDGHSNRVNVVAIFDDGRRAVSASWDNTVRIWDLEEGNEIRTLEGHSARVNIMAIFDDGRRAVSTSGRSDNTLKVWDLIEGKEIHTLMGHSRMISALAIFNDGQRVVSTSFDNTLRVWDLTNGSVIASFTGECAMMTCAVSKDDKTIVAGDALGRVHFLRLEGME